MIPAILNELYKNFTGNDATEIAEMPSSGSNRRYFRLKGEHTLIGVVGTSVEENNAFIYMSAHFAQKGLPVPKVLICSDDHIAYLQEDLGDTIIYNDIEKGLRARVFC